MEPRGICGVVEKHVVALCHELLPCWPRCQVCFSEPSAWWEVMGRYLAKEVWHLQPREAPGTVQDRPGSVTLVL